MKSIQYRGYEITESDPFVTSISSTGRMEYSRVVKIDGKHEVFNGVEWELLNSVKRAQQLIDSGCGQFARNTLPALKSQFWAGFCSND